MVSSVSARPTQCGPDDFAPVPRPAASRGSPWVWVALAGCAAGWVYRQVGARRSAAAGLSAADRRVLMQAVEQVWRARSRAARGCPGAVLAAVYALLRLRASLAAVPPMPLKSALSQARALDAPGAEPRARSRSLVALAARIAPLAPTTAERVWLETCNGGVSSIACARDEALARLNAFRAHHGLSGDTGPLRELCRALVVPHDARHLPAVSLHRLGPLWARQPVLVYRPEAFELPEANVMPEAPSSLPAFAALQPEVGARRRVCLGPAAHRARAVLRLALGQMLGPGLARAFDDGACGRVAHTLEAVWGERPGGDAMVEQLREALAQVLGDVVWGEHMPPGYSDRLGFSQLVFQVLARDARRVPGVLAGSPQAMRLLVEALISEAHVLRASWEHSMRWVK